MLSNVHARGYVCQMVGCGNTLAVCKSVHVRVWVPKRVCDRMYALMCARVLVERSPNVYIFGSVALVTACV